jgi:putative membrane protein
MKMKMLIGATIGATLVMSSTSFAQDKQSQSFLTEAIQGNLAEVQMGQLAQKNGANQGVRSFGQMLETDHKQANQKATEAAKSLKVTAPTEPNAKQKSDYERLSKLNGSMFDSEFVQHMIMDHEKDIKDYEKASSMSDAAGNYAHESLPVLRKHLETAQSLKPAATTGAGR